MQWLKEVIDKAETRLPEGEILVSSGASPSGTYHVGHLREVIICDAIVLMLQQKGRKARHIHVVDDLDAFRKVPLTIPESYNQYLGMPLCEVPAPDGSDRSYADYCLDPFLETMRYLGIEFEVVYQHRKYREGFYVPAIERSLKHMEQAKDVISKISGRKLDSNWTPIQILENGRLKNRKFVNIDTNSKTISYVDINNNVTTVPYDKGLVKIDWRLDWPGRWWLMQVAIEPFGRDHATKGGSYDTGSEIARKVYDIEPPIPVPYEFVNRTGDTKKMSASRGTGVNAYEMADVLPAEIIRFFMLRSSASKRLFFDETDGLVRLIDEYSQLISKKDKTELDREILFLSQRDKSERSISSIPFSHLVTTFQASLRNTERTLEIIARSEYRAKISKETEQIRKELMFIDRWLDKWAPDEMTFTLLPSVNANEFNDAEKDYLSALATDILNAPQDAHGIWFHELIYSYKEKIGFPQSDLFKVLYRAIIGRDSGPRAGYFLSVLPRDWLIKRLLLEA